MTNKTLLLLAVAGFTAPLAEAMAQEPLVEPEAPALSTSAEVDVNSLYLWRGAALSSSPVLQPWVGVSGFDFTLSVFANVFLGNEGQAFPLSEVDPTLAYSRSFGPVAIEPSLCLYFVPSGGDAVGELALKASLDLSMFTLTTNHAVGFLGTAGSYYADLGLGWAADLTSALQLSAALRGMWSNSAHNEPYFGVAHSAFTSAAVDLGVKYALSSALYLRPHGTVVALLDEVLMEGSGRDRWAYSLGLAVGAGF